MKNQPSIPPTDEHHVEVRSEAEAVERRTYQRRAADRSGELLAACKMLRDFVCAAECFSGEVVSHIDGLHVIECRTATAAIAAAERLEPQPDRLDAVRQLLLKLDIIRGTCEALEERGHAVIIARTVEEIVSLLERKES